ncbi:FecR family protein [Chitinophaga vietnamensis]|uniref:FecR family protein n=1 Tax=Chitinophaga vietnamensis TaxID=2593957 RepID=UPI001178CAC6|nr:FecR family protein [Chitinophaga vietnamensis]
MPDIVRLRYLLEQAQESRATTEEYAELLAMIEKDEDGETIDQINHFHSIDTLADAGSYDRAGWQATLQAILDADKAPLHAAVVRRIAPWKWWAAAAAVLLIGAGLWLRTPHSMPAPHVAPVAAHNADIKPGGNKAILVLGDGSQISLDSAANGTLARQGNTSITKAANGQLQYSNAGNVTAITWNTLKTPMGGQYKLTLADGTTVWLNAGSSITYPTAFTGNERNVNITGEAYFEVAQLVNQPFKVKAGSLSVEVLGTHFNINAYDNEAAIHTTLLEGAVKIKTGSHEHLLAPGQQARVANGSANIQVLSNVNTAASVAWKEGYFSFDNADIQTVMRQLARWYNIEVAYEGSIPSRAFTGEIGRSLTLAQVLKGLSKTRIRYRIENGNRIVILP